MRQLLIFALATLPALAQDSAFDGPVVGWMFDSKASALRPILGVPGAATFGDPLPAELPLRRAAINPGADHALAVDENGLVLIELKTNTARRVAIDIGGAVDHIVWSPTGSSALIVSSESRRAIVLGALPAAPETRRDFTLEPPVNALAVSDDGSAVAVASASGILVYPRDSDPWHYAQTDCAAIAFAPDSNDLAFASKANHLVALIRNREVSAAAGEAEGIANPSAVRFSRDGKSLIIAAANTVAFIARESFTVTAIPCACIARVIEPLGPATYRISGDDPGPVWMLLMGEVENRLLFVPPPVVPEAI